MVSKVLFSSHCQEWETPLDLFLSLNKEFRFTLDPCCTSATAKCKLFFTRKENGLLQSWKGQRVFCNPPYGREIIKWVKKCYDESRDVSTLVVMLIPARTDTRYFHSFIYKTAREIRFIKGRLRFGKSKNTAPFPSMIVIF